MRKIRYETRRRLSQINIPTQGSQDRRLWRTNVGQSFFHNKTVVPAPNLPNKTYAGDRRATGATADTVATCDAFDSHVAVITRIRGLHNTSALISYVMVGAYNIFLRLFMREPQQVTLRTNVKDANESSLDILTKASYL